MVNKKYIKRVGIYYHAKKKKKTQYRRQCWRSHSALTQPERLPATSTLSRVKGGERRHVATAAEQGFTVLSTDSAGYAGSDFRRRNSNELKLSKTRVSITATWAERVTTTPPIWAAHTRMHLVSIHGWLARCLLAYFFSRQSLQPIFEHQISHH